MFRMVRLAAASLVALALLVSCSAPSPAPLAPVTPSRPAPTPTPASTFRIIGYVGDDAIVSLIQFDKLTHINYAFLIPNADGTMGRIANPWKLKEIVSQAHAKGVKVLISVGGWGWDDQFEKLAADPETRATFVKALDEFARTYDLDGVDMDWEYPDPGESSENFTALMRELNARLRPQGKLLTAAVVAVGPTGEGISAEVFEMVDFLNLMAYDGPYTNHSAYQYAEESLRYWRARGLPPEKTVLGVPFYARPGEVPYRKLVEADPEAVNVDEAEYHSSTTYYNGLPTLRQKTDLARREASGIMIWALAHDTNDSTSLLGGIYDAAHSP
jgi:GH18 family chitinase